MYANNLLQSPKKYREDGSAVMYGMITHSIAVLLDLRTTVMLTACTKFERGKARTAGRRSLWFIPVLRRNQKTADCHSETNDGNDVHWLQEQIIPNSEQNSVLVIGNAVSHNTKTSNPQHRSQIRK
jgi:hypothetical protein